MFTSTVDRVEFYSRECRRAWNLLSENLRKSTSITVFKRYLKTFSFRQITHSAH